MDNKGTKRLWGIWWTEWWSDERKLDEVIIPDGVSWRNVFNEYGWWNNDRSLSDDHGVVIKDDVAIE
jgi:hypothetical protein